MKVKMKQNKNSSFIRIFAFVCSLVVLFCSISFPAFASVNGLDFSGQPIPVRPLGISEDASYSASYKFSHYVNGDIGALSRSSTSRDIYVFCVGTEYYFCSESSDAEYNIYYPLSNSSINTVGWQSLVTQDSSSGLYYYGWEMYGSSTTTLVPSFNSISDGFAAVLNYIGSTSSSPHPLSLTVPAGNCLYIDVSGVSTVQMSLSMSSDVAHPQQWISNQYYGSASSYPVSIAGNPSGSTPIPWSGYGDKTILNRYKSFSWSLTSVGGSNFLFVCNPYASIDEYDQSFNPTIYVSVNQAVGYKYYQLTGGIGSDGTIGQQSDGTTASGTYDDSTGEWSTINDQTGAPWTPSEGGGNIITQNSINSWLQQISTQIGNFFSGAIGAVTTLVSAGSDFIHSLSGLYAWLPAPVYSVLVSALILVITIGVIKVFI